MRILNSIETLDEVLENKKSIARFGDGEIEVIVFQKRGINTGNYSPMCWKQDYSKELESELIEVLTSPSENVLVASYPCLTLENEEMWKRYRPSGWNTASNMQKYLMTLFYYFNSYPKYLGNAFVFRDILCEYETQEIIYNKICNFFKDKNVMVVSSRKTDIQLELFNQTNVEYLECPHNNAYSVIDELEKNIIHEYSLKNIDVVVLSAGPGCLMSCK